MQKHYHYRKVTPEIEKEMKELRKEGLSYEDIGKIMRLHQNTVRYHLNSKERKKVIERTQKYNKKMTLKQRKEKSRKQLPYLIKYLKERYNNDKLFRKNFIEMIMKNFKKRREVWRKKRLCSTCGGKRKDKQFATCKKCREKKRRYTKKYYDGKNRQ